MNSLHDSSNGRGSVLLTGATGLIGGEVARRLLSTHPGLRIQALVRRREQWPTLLSRLGGGGARVTPVFGELRAPGLGLDAANRAGLRRTVGSVIHCAGDVTFSRPLEQARATNTEGTRNLLEVLAGVALCRFLHVSTAFAAGRARGSIPEEPLPEGAGFVNGYEQSKHEAEGLVRSARPDAWIVRPSTVVCDAPDGSVTQINSVHRALRICYAGLAAVMPGSDESTLDVVTTEYVAEGIVRLALSARDSGLYHLCAGRRAIPLPELLDRCLHFWSRDPAWRARGILPPALTDLATYGLFERSIEQTGNSRLIAISRSLSHFVPQLALPKQFGTDRADAALGFRAPDPREYWEAMLAQLLRARWGRAERRAA